MYLEIAAEYYEKALYFLNNDNDREEIIYSLLTVYAELGEKEKAENAWTKMPTVKYEKDWAHAEMLYNLKEYDASIPEIKEIILRKLVDISGFLSALYDAFRHSGDGEMAEYIKGKFSEFREVFGLWDGFGPKCDDENPFKTEGPKKLAISSCPLFDGVTFELTDLDNTSFIAIIDKLMKQMNKK